MKFKQFLQSKIFVFLAVAFFLRLFLSFFGTLRLDFNTFVAWSNILVEKGFVGFYQGWSDYLPGYLYILFLLGKVNTFLPLFTVLVYKLPAMTADILTGLLIYKIVKPQKNEKIALIATAFYVFNPAIFANSTLWGQVDSLTAFFSLLSVYLVKTNPILSSVVLAYAASVKPQAAIASLVILFMMFRDEWKITKIAGYIFLSLTTFLVTFIPFAGKNSLLPFVVQRISVSLNQYPFGSVNAFNFWGLFGFWQPDNGLISASVIGGVIILSVFTLFAFKLKKKDKGEYFLLAILFLAEFLFQARMHERHLLPSLAPLIISGVLILDLIPLYFIVSLTYLANLYYSYVWITNDFKTVFSFDAIKIIIVVNIVSFLFCCKLLLGKNREYIIPVFRRLLRRFRNRKTLPRKTERFEATSIISKRAKYLFWAVVVFSLISRLAWLNSPSKDYFDEIYHAFTARIILHGDPKAWEWWNPHPEGFAYEWTHPPVSKLGMVLGMKLFGENAFGWRFPGAILGVGCVILVYLLAKKLFNDEKLAIIAAFVFSLDGLTLTMSRIGMNDTYMLFFSLLSVFLFLQKKDFGSAFFLGFAVSSKWSAVWTIPILGLIWLSLRKDKLTPSIIWFFILPPLVYLASYFPMFLTGHNLETFWGMQKQMWWYHTGLKATHPYTSAWWSWPFLLRPVYLYTSDEIGGWVARIYNLGNPLVFWFGLTSIICSLIYAFLEKNKNIALVVFSYLVYFVPWAASPRIMFFYHYLPSLPFLAIATGYVLRKNQKIIIPFLIISFLTFIYFYPHWAGLTIPLWLDKSYYWFSSWR